MMRSRLGLLVVTGAVLLGGCRSGGGPTTSTHRFAGYRRCLEQHGVTPPRQADRGSTTTTDPAAAAAFTAARHACASLRPQGGLRSGELKGHVRGAFRRCLQDHGVTLPTAGTTGTSGSGSRGGMLAGLDRHDPTVAQALKACRSKLVGHTG